jgi:hypothetical protein
LRGRGEHSTVLLRRRPIIRLPGVAVNRDLGVVTRPFHSKPPQNRKTSDADWLLATLPGGPAPGEESDSSAGMKQIPRFARNDKGVGNDRSDKGSVPAPTARLLRRKHGTHSEIHVQYERQAEYPLAKTEKAGSPTIRIAPKMKALPPLGLPGYLGAAVVAELVPVFFVGGPAGGWTVGVEEDGGFFGHEYAFGRDDVPEV